LSAKFYLLETLERDNVKRYLMETVESENLTTQYKVSNNTYSRTTEFRKHDKINKKTAQNKDVESRLINKLPIIQNPEISRTSADEEEYGQDYADSEHIYTDDLWIDKILDIIGTSKPAMDKIKPKPKPKPAMDYTDQKKKGPDFQLQIHKRKAFRNAAAIGLLVSREKPLENLTLESFDLNVKYCIPASLKKSGRNVDKEDSQCDQSEGEFIPLSDVRNAQLKEKLEDPKQPWSHFEKGNKLPGSFLPEYRKSVASLAEILNSIDDFQELLSTVAVMRESNHVNEIILQHALTIAILKRDDISQNFPAPTLLVPEIFFSVAPSNDITTGRNHEDYANADWIRLPDEHIIIPEGEALGSLPDGDPEIKMNYWREDFFLHVFHHLFHEIYRVEEHRVFEMFGYMHAQLMKRYDTERVSNGLSPVPCLGLDELRKPIPGSYKPVLWYNHLGVRKENCQLHEESLNSIEEQYQEVTQMIKDGIDFEQFAEKMDNGYHSDGHVYISMDCIEGEIRDANDTYYQGYGPMLSTTTSARDPVFYRWHCEIERLMEEYKQTNMKRYTVEDFNLSGDVALEEAFVVNTDGGDINKLGTFKERKRMNHNGKFYVTYTRLNHQRFTFHIRLRNPNKIKKKVMIRIFLGKSVNMRKGMIEMDRWLHTLNGEESEEIERRDEDSTATMSVDHTSVNDIRDSVITGRKQGQRNDCGFPQNLFLPRGKEDGEDFELVFVVTDVTNDDVSSQRHMFCGLGEIVDEKSYGFPFDRDWNFDIVDIIPPKGRSLLIQQVKIFHLPDPGLSEGDKSSDTELTTKSQDSISEVVKLQTIEEEKRKEKESTPPQTQVQENLSIKEDISERTSPGTPEDNDKESTTPAAQERGHEITSSPKYIQENSTVFEEVVQKKKPIYNYNPGTVQEHSEDNKLLQDKENRDYDYEREMLIKERAMKLGLLH